jgi:hypothetical protein
LIFGLFAINRSHFSAIVAKSIVSGPALTFHLELFVFFLTQLFPSPASPFQPSPISLFLICQPSIS